LNDIKPVSATDAIARQHDIDYLISNGNSGEAFLDDMKALSSISEITPESIAMGVGLTLRSIINEALPNSMNFNTSLEDMSKEDTKVVGLYLNDILNRRLQKELETNP